MNSTHPTAEQLDQYRRRVAEPAELLAIDAHVATCDRCFDAVRSGAAEVVLPPMRGEAHLTYDEMEAFVDGRADATEREIVTDHLALCERCRGEVADLKRMQESLGAVPLPRARTRMRWLVAAAAIVLAVLAAAFFFRRERAMQTPPVVRTTPVPAPATAPPANEPQRVATLTKPAIVDTLVGEQVVLRGATERAALALLAPVGTVVLDERPSFRWTPVAEAKTYDVAVADAENGSVAATGSSDTTSWQPSKPLPRGRTYAWQVTAHTSLDTIVAPGPSAPEALFHVAEAAAAAELAPKPEQSRLERGVALAERGVLDDAERELELAAREGEARAADLLTEVRSWRGDYRALPTTTNGAQ